MNSPTLGESGTLGQELALGLAYAWQSHFADAADHFARARDEIAPTHSQLITALDAFVQSHARYWEAEQALHEASVQFSGAAAEQQLRLEELQRVLATLGTETESRPRPTLADRQARRTEAEWERHEAIPHAPLPSLAITCFGRFLVRRGGAPLALCQNRNGQAILRFLVTQPDHRATIDILLDALWPDDDPDTARHKLYVAISALRRALNGDYVREKGMGYLLCENGAYQLNPAVRIEIDADAFMEQYRAGQRAGGAAAVPHFEAACRLYTGPYLTEDLYADWSVIRREQLAQAYLTMCAALAGRYLDDGALDEAARWANATLAENRCDEVAYRQLMCAYARQGRRSEALRLYQRCERVLEAELGVEPMPATRDLFERILQGAPVSPPVDAGLDHTDSAAASA